MIRAKVEIPIRSSALVLGFVLAALLAAASLVLTAKPALADATFTVNVTGDEEDANVGDRECDTFRLVAKPCTLRAAIQEANATPGADTIKFNIPDDPNVPGNEVKTISPTSQLPEITEAVTIDGYSQDGASPNTLTQPGKTNANPLIQLDGFGAGEFSAGLEINPADVTVRGLVINRFGDDGIEINSAANDPEPTGVKIEGNFIGTDAAGQADLGNEGGVQSVGGKDNAIGGTAPEARNLISGNDRKGVLLSGGSDGSKVLGNLIGTKKDGIGNLGNSEQGVAISGSSNTFVGDGAAGAANAIAFNGDVGVSINFSGSNPNNANGNRVLGNSIFSNDKLGIDLGDDGPTTNDPKDRDTGPNNLQNVPVLTSAEKASGKFAIKGKLNSTPNKRFTIQFFSNPPNENEGKTFLGQKRVTTNREGKVSFTFETSKRLPAGARITATATGPGGNTSEFSDPETLFID